MQNKQMTDINDTNEIIVNTKRNDNSENRSDKSINKKNRKNKKVFYEKERNDIVDKLNFFTHLTEKNNSIFDFELYNNKDLIDYLRNNSLNIKKYYRCSTWGYFVSENNNQKGDEITLLKAIYRDHGYDIYRKDTTHEFGGIKKRYTKFIFCKK